MKNISRIESEEFETLLRWLSDDREQAGVEYNEIRAGLIRFFRFKGCSDPQTLADETLNRVAGKISTLDKRENVKKSTIIYGFAKNVALEYLRVLKREDKSVEIFEINKLNSSERNNDHLERKLDCMNKCLAGISEENRRIFIEYYGHKKSDNMTARKKMAESLDCEIKTLHVRVFRLRKILIDCIENCLKKSL